jgi:hypothetical protein
MTLRLNESRPYGSIHPPLDGAFYEQDGKLFGHDMVLLSKAGADKGAAQSAPSSSKAKTTTQPEDVDLQAWARGEIKPPFFAVKKSALAKYPDIDTTNAGTIKAYLANLAGEPEGDD